MEPSEVVKDEEESKSPEELEALWIARARKLVMSRLLCRLAHEDLTLAQQSRGDDESQRMPQDLCGRISTGHEPR